MSDSLDPRPGWVRQRTRELHRSGLKWTDARKQAEAEADDKFDTDNGENGNGTA